MRKKRIVALAVAFLLTAALLAGCAGGNLEKENEGLPDGTVTIAASFYPIYIMLLNVTADIPGIEAVDMTQPTTGCLHDYSVTPGDLKKLEDASILVINGAGMESFMDKVIAQFPDLTVVDSSEGIPRLPGAEGDNPHFWVSISDAIVQVENIGNALEKLLPERADELKANTEAYINKLEAEKTKMHEALDGLENRNIVTFHEAFPYFAEEFDLNIVGVIEREPGSEPSARELADTVDIINELGVKALFAEPQYPAGAAETIARETGAEVYVLDPAVTGPMDKDAYLNIMDKNLTVLKEALS
jgi:zinc transport system substrate-binding protein